MMTATGVMAGAQGRLAGRPATGSHRDPRCSRPCHHMVDYTVRTILRTDRSSMPHSRGGRGRVRKRGRDLVVACAKTRRQADHQRTDDPRNKICAPGSFALQQVLLHCTARLLPTVGTFLIV